MLITLNTHTLFPEATTASVAPRCQKLDSERRSGYVIALAWRSVR
jgi:hypothetical protein